MVVTDWFTKWVEIFPLPDITAQTVSKILVEEIICRFGAPKEILTDRGSDFTSSLFRAVCHQCNTVKVYSTPYAPQTQGVVERFNRTHLNMISTTVGPSRQWDTVLPYLRLTYNSAVHEVTGYSPFYLSFGRHPKLPHDLSLTVPSGAELNGNKQFLEKIRKNLETAWDAARRSISTEQQRQKVIYDRTAHKLPIEVGSLVMLKLPQKLLEGISKKLHSKWNGPFRVLRMEGENCIVSSLDDPFSPPRKIHLRLVAPYYSRDMTALQQPVDDKLYVLDSTDDEDEEEL